MATTIKLRRDTAANWASVDPILASGEPGWDATNDIFKIGDGVTAWSSLPEVGSGSYVPQASARIWLPATSFLAVLGAPANSPLNGRRPAFFFDQTSDERIGSPLVFPSWWSTFDASLYWTNAGAGSGDVFWQLLMYAHADGADLSAGSNTQDDLTVTAPAQNVLKVSALATGRSVASGVGSLVVRRNAGNVADTLANDAAVVGLLLTRAS